MAYGTKYQFTWESQNGADCSILIQKDGYSGSIAVRHLGRAPVLKRKNSGRVYGTSLEIYAECSVDQEFSELYTPNAREYKVLLQRGNNTIWTGFVSPELYAEPDIAPPYDVQIIATDGLGELKQYTFAAQGEKSLGQLFSYLISFSGGTGNINRISYLQGQTSAGTTVSEYSLWNTALINIDYKAGESCYDVLQYLLTTLCASITFHNNAWLIWRDNEISASNSSPVSIGSIGGASGVWPVGQLTTKVEPAKKKITVEAPFHKWTPLVNPDMDRDAGWIKNDYVSFDTTRQGYKFYCPYTTGYTDDIGSLWQSIANVTILEDLVLTLNLGLGQYGNGIANDGEFDINISFIVSGQPTLKLFWDLKNDTLIWATSQPSGATRMYYKVTNREETVNIPAIPSSLSAYQTSGTIKIEFTYQPRPYSGWHFGYEFYIYSAFLSRDISKGFRDVLNIDNGARGDGDNVEIAQGRVTAGMVSVYYGYLRGVFTYGGNDFVTSFIDSKFSSYSDFMALAARNYARLVALPLLRITGKVNTPASFAVPMLMGKGGVNYLLKTCSWDMKNDELEIDALSLPSGTLTIESEQVIDTTGEASASGGGSGSGSSSGGGTVVAWGTEGADHFSPLTVAGDQRSVALSGHGHTTSQVTHGDDTLADLIPNAATDANQLADKSFVNSSIATATATFRGTSAAGLTEQQFMDWAYDLPAYDQNDYIFWNTVDAAGNTQFKRYKFSGASWVYEYTLNNSSFTADQWAAINSAITSGLVTKLNELPTAAQYQTAMNNKQDKLTFDDVPTAGSSNPVKSSGIKSALDGKSNTGHTHNWEDLTNRPMAGNKGLPVFAHPGGTETDPQTGNQTTVKQGQPYPVDHIGTHPELDPPIIIPLLSNDLAYLRTRGGACSVTVNSAPVPAYDVDAMFDNSPLSMEFQGTKVVSGTTYNLALTSKDAIVGIKITTPGMTEGIETATINNRTCYYHKSNWNSRFFIDFGNAWWSADSVTVLVKYGYWYYNNGQLVVVEPNNSDTGVGARQTFTFSNPSTWSGGTLTQLGGNPFVVCPFGSKGGYGVIEIDITLTGFHPDTSESSSYKFKPRVSEIGLINMKSPGPGGPLMSRGIDSPIFRNLSPGKNANYDLGTNAAMWNKLYTKRVYLSATAYLEVDTNNVAHLYGAAGLVVENGDIASAGPQS